VTDKQPEPTERRMTPSERQHEALMALATKMSPRAQQTFSAKRVTIGDMKGEIVMEGYTCPKADEEDFPQWLGRMQDELQQIDTMLIRMNRDRIDREAAVMGGPKAVK
jgi:hypothetical protein